MKLFKIMNKILQLKLTKNKNYLFKMKKIFVMIMKKIQESFQKNIFDKHIFVFLYDKLFI